ncbi:MAG: CPBP family intramembrane metalloprotease [Anaerolineae bacterium]|nr:CPBP family intramembrane metalloprotease [Anaerolineae bacterium]
MDNAIDKKRIGIFLGFAFGIAWGIAVIIALTGGLVNSPELIPATGITLALVLVALGYMWAPAISHILTRWLTREGWAKSGLQLRIKEALPFYVTAWLAPAVLTILGTILYFILFPGNFDAEFSTINTLLAATEGVEDVEPWTVFIIQVAASVLSAPLVNSIFTFGEEFGWRGYLQQKLMPLGVRRAMIAMGIIWGVWHWPMIAMGHNYGLDYPGAPWAGMLMMVWFTFTSGVFLSFVTLRSGSVWPAVIGHAAINGIANIGALFVKGIPNPLWGPLPVGFVGCAAWGGFAIWLMVRTDVLTGTDKAAT